jgi:hypothetical protein
MTPSLLKKTLCKVLTSIIFKLERHGTTQTDNIMALTICDLLLRNLGYCQWYIDTVHR